MADQAVDLTPKGRKSNQVNHSQQPKKPAPGIIVGRPANGRLVPSPERNRNNRGKFPVPGNKFVPESGHNRVARKTQVTPERPSAPQFRSIAEHPANGFRTPVDVSIGFNQPDSRLETFDWNVRTKARSYRLERSDVDSAAHRFLPAADPADAKITVCIIDQERPLGGRCAMNEAIRTLNRCRFRRWHREASLRSQEAENSRRTNNLAPSSAIASFLNSWLLGFLASGKLLVPWRGTGH